MADVMKYTVSQTFFGTFGVAMAESIFTNHLLVSLPKCAPGVGRVQVLSVSASELRQVFTAVQIPGLSRSFVVGLRAAWIASIALCGWAFCASLIALRVSVKKEGK